MRRPDLFLVGAPKCGTTALGQYLSEHPAVFMCEPKEPNYFTDFEYPRFRYVDSLSGYLELFAGADASHRAVGEASVSYLFIPEAIDRLREFEPAARIIVLLRDPVTMVQAWHAQLVYNREESEADFETAWNLQDERRVGRRLPRFCRDRRALLYRDVAGFALQLEHLFSRFPRRQVLVLLQEDLAERTAEVYEQTLAFLGLPSDRRTDFPRVNVAKVAESALLRWTAQPPTPLLHASRWIKRRLGLRGRSLLATWRLRRAKVRPRPPLDPRLRGALAAEFGPGIARLEALLERDLGHWARDPRTVSPAEPGPTSARHTQPPPRA